MEDGQNLNPAVTQDSLMMKSLAGRDRNDVMTRRLKNRERQRRYRARKRLEADMKKSSVLNHTTTPQIELQLNGNFSNCVTRVHCKRDWKKDARRASTFKGQDTPNGPGNKAEALQVKDCETNKPKLARRDWKAEARKKSS